MINESLHQKPIALDRVAHRALKLDRTARDLSRFKELNAFFVSAGEFADACRDFALVWVTAGKDPQGNALVAPIAVFGLQAKQNLCIDNDQWRVRYIPAMLRFYPFAMARTSDTEIVLCVDEAWKGLSNDSGELLFNADGTPTELVAGIQQQLQAFEADVERTKVMGARLMALGLLREMRFDATLPDGQKIEVNGFLAVDEEKLTKLDDTVLVELARSGLLGMIHAHQISMGNMTRLVEWQAAAMPAAAAPTAANG